MIKKKTIHRKRLPKWLLSKINKDLLPYLVPSKTSSIEKTNAPTKMDLVSKTAKPALYPEELNPFRVALNEIKLNEDENMKLNEFLEKVAVAKDIEELNKIVNQALDSGIRINAPNEKGYSFSNITIFKLCEDKFKGDKQENIIRKLAINGADFDESFIKDNKKIIDKVQKEVEPIVFNRLKKLREVAEVATIEGTVGNVEIDNKTFHIEFSQNSRVDVSKVFNGARDLGLSKGDLKLGGNIVRLGESEVEIKPEKNGRRNYVDVLDNSAFDITFSTSLGSLNIIIYHNLENYHQVQVEVRGESKKIWNELQKKGEILGSGCLLGGISVDEAIEQGYFMRSGRFCDQKSTEIVSNFKSSETLSWSDRSKGKETKPVVRGG